MNTICAWTMLLTWVNMIGLLRPFSSCGPFINMILVISAQILPFLALFVMILWSFGFAFYMSIPVLTDAADFQNNPTEMSFEDPLSSFAVTFLMSVGEFADYLTLLSSKSYSKLSTVILFVIFLVIVFLILFNLLIAIMGEAYVVFEREAREYLFSHSLTQRTHSCHLHNQPISLSLVTLLYPSLATIPSFECYGNTELALRARIQVQSSHLGRYR